MLRVIAYTGGHNAPARVPRVQQYVHPLENMNIELTECASLAGSYPPDQKWKRPFWGAWNLFEHVPAVLQSYEYDVTFLHREMLSTYVTLEPFTKKPRVFDVDDAIWVHRSGAFARRLASLCDHVICGNQFLAEEFSRFNPHVSILPSSVDTRKFYPAEERRDNDHPVIGWMGLHSGRCFLYAIEPALRRILKIHPKATLRIVSDRPPEFRTLPPEQIEYVQWSPESQVRLIQEMTIGIMPLDDTVVSRGKCSYKMLLYMACGIPVVVSPIGMNAEVLRKGPVGLGAINTEQWVAHLDELIRHPEERLRMGRSGRQVIVDHYSVNALAPRLAKTLFTVSGQEDPCFQRTPHQQSAVIAESAASSAHTGRPE